MRTRRVIPTTGIRTLPSRGERLSVRPVVASSAYISAALSAAMQFRAVETHPVGAAQALWFMVPFDAGGGASMPGGG